MVAHFAAARVRGLVGNHNTHLVPPELAYQLDQFCPHVLAVSPELSEVADRAMALAPAASAVTPARLAVPWKSSADAAEADLGRDCRIMLATSSCTI